MFHLGSEGAGEILISRCEAGWLGYRGVIKGDNPALALTQMLSDALRSERWEEMLEEIKSVRGKSGNRTTIIINSIIIVIIIENEIFSRNMALHNCGEL